MKLPLSWLKDFLPLTKSPEEIAAQLTLLGIEVENILQKALSFSGVVVGKVLSAEQHPNADRLSVAKVTDGTEEFQVVCGAPNCRAGIFVALARVGASLTDPDGKVWKIKKSKIRDVESQGMLCSGKELFLSAEHEGILELPDNSVLGVDFSSFFTDPVFEISITPNLGHVLSVLGIARELSAAFQIPMTVPSFELKESGAMTLLATVENPELCQRYCLREIRGVNVGPSPEWLQKRLEASGLRSINNIVDATNYVMMEMGQPLHAFDQSKINGQIKVTANGGFATLVTLDEKERALPPHTLLICDEEKPLAIAGIMGGLSSSVTAETKNIILEAACFNPSSVRKTARLLDLRSDSSYRFERGIDPAAIPMILDRAAALIVKLAGGDVLKGKIDIKAYEQQLEAQSRPFRDELAELSIQDAEAKPGSLLSGETPSFQEGVLQFTPKKLSLREERVNALLGTDLSLSEITSLLNRLGMSSNLSDGKLHVAIPTYRNDINIEVDLIEEIARLYGYNHLPKRAPYHISSPIPDAPIYQFETKVRTHLLESGLQECITCDLISPEISELTAENSEPTSIAVLAPRSIDQSILRTSLMPGLLMVAKHNLQQQIKTLALFEVGRIHWKEGDQFKEETCAGILLSGFSGPHSINPKSRAVDFFDLKGIIENILGQLGIERVEFVPSHLKTLHPGQQAKIQLRQTTLGVLGQVHPHLTHTLGCDEPLFFAELNLHDLFPLKKTERHFSPLPQFPSSERDWTLSVTTATPVAMIDSVIKSIKSPLLESFYLLDLYQNLADRKNVTYRFVYRSYDKTIDYESVQKEHTKITQAVAEKLHDRIILG